MHRMTIIPGRHVRCGITHVEVILTILGFLLLLFFLLSLVLPQVGGGPAPARVQCLNNLKNLALAAQNYAIAHGGNLVRLSDFAPGQAASSGKTPWTMQLLPYLDRADTHEYIQEAKTSEDATTRVSAVLSQSYNFLQCPSDPRHSRQPGGISYAANIGYGAWRGVDKSGWTDSDKISTVYDFGAKDHSPFSIDWNANGKQDSEDAEFARSTGVFWNSPSGKTGWTLDEISGADGLSQTILFMESLSLPPMNQAGPLKNGLNPGALETGSGLGYFALGLGKQSHPELVSHLTQAPQQFTRYFRPNANRSRPTEIWPGASSLHNGVVNVVFAGGYAKSISDQIDWKVWAALHSPDGLKWGETKVRDTDY